MDDNRRTVDEAAALGSSELVLVCGPAPDRDLESARAYAAEAIAELGAYAGEAGVRLGIEPLHPMYAGDRSVVVTLGQANAIARQIAPERAGVVVNAYHVWWDPQVFAEIERAAGRILGYHVSDWLVPAPDPLLGRGLMGDGVVRLRPLRAAVEATGYDGPIEVEICNRAVWDAPGDQVVEQVKARYLACV